MPKVDDYPTDPGDHGIMARYQSFNLSAGADAALEFLEALYVLHDSFEKAYKGYITLMKLLGCMFEENGVVFREENDLTDREGDFVSYVVKNIDHVLPQIFDAMECQYVFVQPVTENPFKTFRKPTVPVLTRNGFVKFVLVNYLDRAGRGDYRPHNILFAITEKYRLLVPGTSRPVMPIDDRKQVEKNFRDLATELQIPLERIIRQIRSFKDTPAPPAKAEKKSAAPVTTGGGSYKTYAPSNGSDRGGPVYEQPPASEYSRYRSDYSSKSYRSPSPEGRAEYSKSPPSPHRERRDRDRERDIYNLKPSPTYFSPPPQKPTSSSKKSAAEVLREKEWVQRQREEKEKEWVQRQREEKERMEILAAERELKDMEKHYERMAKEREFKNEMEYINAQKRGLEAATRSMEESTERMRRVGLDEYDWRYRERY
ncbi:hypothetical protein TWF481_002257 [Arthrobotrys musiformis]|uniref:DUF7514 domain-containing protein n=1 Tax=Arthrobotrys musiformis TaxID=47236 RepID=A0AAV9VUB6_9PEZI